MKERCRLPLEGRADPPRNPCNTRLEPVHRGGFRPAGNQFRWPSRAAHSGRRRRSRSADAYTVTLTQRAARDRPRSRPRVQRRDPRAAPAARDRSGRSSGRGTRPQSTCCAALSAVRAEHPMGTDDLGRDMFARFNRGRAHLAPRRPRRRGGRAPSVGGADRRARRVRAAAASTRALMRCMDALLAFPPLVLAMAVTVGLGVGLVTAAIGIVLTSIPWYARLRAQRRAAGPLARRSSRPRVALGATPRRHHRCRHILPNVLARPSSSRRPASSATRSSRSPRSASSGSARRSRRRSGGR